MFGEDIVTAPVFFLGDTHRLGGFITSTPFSSVYSTNAIQIDVSSWEQIDSAIITQTTPGSSKCYHAVSFDARSTWKVFLSCSMERHSS